MHQRLWTLAGWHRLLLGAAIGFLVALPPWPTTVMVRGLIGWCVGATVFLLPAFWLAEHSDAARTRARAKALDQPSALILASMLMVVGASVVAVAMLLGDAKNVEGTVRAAHIALGLVALAGSWLMIHTIYGFHYAHRYYQEERSGVQTGPGLDFPGKLDPDYFDFLYYSFVVGMTSQVSDVQCTSRPMRRLTLVHSVLSFAFNMLVLALSINVVASAI